VISGGAAQAQAPPLTASQIKQLFQASRAHLARSASPSVWLRAMRSMVADQPYCRGREGQRQACHQAARHNWAVQTRRATKQRGKRGTAHAQATCAGQQLACVQGTADMQHMPLHSPAQQQLVSTIRHMKRTLEATTTQGVAARRRDTLGARADESGRTRPRAAGGQAERRTTDSG